MISCAGVVADGPRRVAAFSIRRRWSRQTNVRWSLRISAPGSRCDSQRIWKPLQMPSTGRPARGRVDDLGHHRREAGDRAAAQVVAVREAAGQHDRVDAVQVGVAVPERDRLAAGEPRRRARASPSSSEPGKVTTPILRAAISASTAAPS